MARLEMLYKVVIFGILLLIIVIVGTWLGFFNELGSNPLVYYIMNLCFFLTKLVFILPLFLFFYFCLIVVLNFYVHL